MCVQNKDVLVEMSLIPFSVGAPPNATAGVVSGVVNQMCRFSTASEKVFAEGQRVIIHTSVTSQNGSVANAIGCQVAPSQSVVMARS